MNKIILIFIIIILLVVIYAVIVTSILIVKNKTIDKFNQTFINIKEEIEKKEEIIKEKNELLDKVKRAKTYKQFLKIWTELNK